jgi:hypothetical protein
LSSKEWTGAPSSQEDCFHPTCDACRQEGFALIIGSEVGWLCCFLRAEASAEHLAPDSRLPRNLFLELTSSRWESCFSPSLNSIVGRAESLGLGAIIMSIVAIHIEATRAAPVTDPSTVQPANFGETKKGFCAIPRARHG